MINIQEMATDLSNIFQLIEKDNGDIILKKVFIDTNLYNVEKSNNNIILKKKKNVKITSIEDLSDYDFKKSSILKCSINGEEVNKNKYKSVLENIYNLIDNGTKIIKNTKLNIKTTEKQDEGFYYLKKLGISVQGVDSNKCLLEILNQCIFNEIDIQIEIELYNNIIVNIEL